MSSPNRWNPRARWRGRAGGGRVTVSQETNYPVSGAVSLLLTYAFLLAVMTAGAAQILMKSSGLVPSGRTILAGAGPLLYLLASQLLRAGVSVIAVVDTTPPTLTGGLALSTALAGRGEDLRSVIRNADPALNQLKADGE